MLTIEKCFSSFFLCQMEKRQEIIEAALVQRIYNLFLEKYNGNKSEFARASQCTETTIRRVLRNEQGITVNLLFRLSYALNIEPSELLKDLSLKVK
jgi:transcriptional regulator with XRE-family HTH domain